MKKVKLDEINDQRPDAKCPNCGSSRTLFDNETGEEICGNCGLVLQQQNISEGQEWRAFDFEEMNSRSRAGPPATSSRSDQIYPNMYGFKDGNGKRLSIYNQKMMQRLNRINNISHSGDSADRNLKIAFKATKMLTDKLGLPEGIFEDAFKVYRKALDKDLIRGKTIEGFVAASLLVVTRSRGIPRSIKEISSAIGLDTLIVTRIYRELLVDLDIKMPIDEPVKYLDKITNKLDFEPRVCQRALEILKGAKVEGGIQGKRPMSIAVAALYLAIRENYIGITQKKLAEISGISEVTLRARSRELEAMRNHDP